MKEESLKLGNNYGFSVNELTNNPAIEIIKSRMKAVVQIGIKNQSKKKAIGTGFFLQKDPPILLTAEHVLPGKWDVKKAFLRFNYDYESPSDNTDYEFEFNNNFLPIISNKKYDYSLIRFNMTPETEYSAVGSNIATPSFSLNDWTFSPPIISIIHHPEGGPKLIATQKEDYSVIQGLPNDLFSYLKDQPEFLKEIKNGFKREEFFPYWARNLDTNELFIRCTSFRSSGAPIFNQDWQLIGMHIKGSYKDLTTQDFFSTGISSEYLKKGLSVI